MLNKDDFQRLGRLLNNLHLLTGIKFSLMDEWGNELYASSFKAPFCGLIMQEESGFERCHACDRKAAEEVGRTQVRRKYLCHAGLYAGGPACDGEAAHGSDHSLWADA